MSKSNDIDMFCFLSAGMGKSWCFLQLSLPIGQEVFGKVAAWLSKFKNYILEVFIILFERCAAISKSE